MPTGKAKKKKPATRKPAKKVLKKKAGIKKSAKKKIAKKEAAKIKAKKTVAKTKPAARKTTRTKPLPVEPGPPPQANPPVEEPAQHEEEALGTITHYYTHLGVAIVQVNKGMVKTGDTIHILGHFTDFTQPVESMEYEHQKIDQAEAGQSVGLQVKDHVRPHDIVYRVK